MAPSNYKLSRRSGPREPLGGIDVHRLSTRQRQAIAAEEAERKRQLRQEEKIRRHREEAAMVELPTHPDDGPLIIPATQRSSSKRPANAAYDDTPLSKRQKIGADGYVKEVPELFIWEDDPSLEQPPTSSMIGSGLDAKKIDPVAAMGLLGKLPVEIRDDILRYILQWKKDIAVLNGWSLVYPRTRPKLDLGITYTCKALHAQSMKILYGENRFAYNIRDPASHVSETHEIFERVFKGMKIPIDKYGHLVKHLKITVDPSRIHTKTKANFTKALAKFIPGQGDLAEPAHIQTLTLDLPAVNSQDTKGFGPLDPHHIPIVNYIGHGTKVRQALRLLNVHFIRVTATDKNKHVFQHTIDLRSYYKKKQETQALKETGEKRVQDCESARRIRDERVHRSLAKIHDLPLRLRELIERRSSIINNNNNNTDGDDSEDNTEDDTVVNKLGALPQWKFMGIKPLRTRSITPEEIYMREAFVPTAPHTEGRKARKHKAMVRRAHDLFERSDDEGPFPPEMTDEEGFE
ncbi:hypothetical protein M426DRAFT_266993 [Hypoxylon sp. CI-4A]|nr:hypothetical protein M426DRAFT_266993 [Hypoxylon sp. CI-4A]